MGNKILMRRADMNEPRISVIIPAYNSSAFIGETLDNLLGQGFDGLEVIVVNDGSADNTADVVASYAEKHGCIRLINKPNGGVSSARNVGIEEARGKYICFQDADDLYAEGTLKAIFATAEEKSADVVICRLRTFNESGLGKFNAFSDKLASMSRIDPFDLQLLWNFLVSNKLYRRSRLVESGIRFPESRYSEEGAFFMSYVFTRPEICGCFGATALYRRHTAEQGLSVSQTVNEGLARSFCRSMDIIYDAAVPATEDMPDDKRAEYLGEIYYKKAYVLVSQFYRLMWHGDDGSVSFCADEISRLLSLMPEGRRDAMLSSDCDLHLDSPCRTKHEAANSPGVSIILKPTKKDAGGFVSGIYAQLSPMFELIIPQSIFESDGFPEEYRGCENLVVLPDKGFSAAAKKAAKGKRITFGRPVETDLRMIRLVYKLKTKLPAAFVDTFFPVLAKGINFALVKGIVK